MTVDTLRGDTITPMNVEEQLFFLARELELDDEIEIVNLREGGALVNCWLPIELVDQDEVPVKEAWAKSVAKSMRRNVEKNPDSDNGQNTEVTLALIPGEKKLKIEDGFHRTAALTLNGATRIYAAVKITDWASLYDERILNSKEHAQVQFSRVVQWIREAWHYSDGLDDLVTVEQAMSLYTFKTSGAKLGLEPADVERIHDWVATKEELWGITAMTIHGDLKVAEHVDPTLVHMTRPKRSGHKLEAPTQAILKVFAREIPDNFVLQNIVLQKAMEKNLKTPYIKALCQLVANCNAYEAQEEVDSVNWETFEPSYADGKERTLRKAYDPRQVGAAALNGATDNIGKVITRINQSLERGDEVTTEMLTRVLETGEHVDELRKNLGEIAALLVELERHADATKDDEDADDEATSTVDTATGDKVDEASIQTPAKVVATPPAAPPSIPPYAAQTAPSTPMQRPPVTTSPARAPRRRTPAQIARDEARSKGTTTSTATTPSPAPKPAVRTSRLTDVARSPSASVEISTLAQRLAEINEPGAHPESYNEFAAPLINWLLGNRRDMPAIPQGRELNYARGIASSANRYNEAIPERVADLNQTIAEMRSRRR